jgi:hypothetical protein
MTVKTFFNHESIKLGINEAINCQKFEAMQKFKELRFPEPKSGHIMAT